VALVRPEEGWKEEGGIEDLEVWAWGGNVDGELGQGTHGDKKQTIPVRVMVEGGRRVRAGGAHTILETKDGKFYVWGWNERNTLGIASCKRMAHPVALELPYLGAPMPGKTSLVVDFVASWYDSMLLLEDGSLVVWGNSVFMNPEPEILMVYKETECEGMAEGQGEAEGEKGGGVKRERVNIVSIGCGYFHAWALSEDGDLFTWGSGVSCGLGNEQHVPTPTQVKNIKFRVPSSKKREWASVFYWLFLGKLDKFSEFFLFPIEVIYHFVQIKW
jgi:alpha-tubulin suppressor-like RCC1 family protein